MQIVNLAILRRNLFPVFIGMVKTWISAKEEVELEDSVVLCV